MQVASSAGPKSFSQAGLKAWAAAELPLMLAGLSGPLVGMADQIACGLCGFPEAQDLAKAQALMALGAFGDSSRAMHSQRWATMLRSGAARWGFAQSLMGIGAIQWSLMASGQTQSAMRLALGIAKQGGLAGSVMARAQARFLRRACLIDPMAARGEMSKAWAAASMPEGGFDAFWSTRVEPRILAAQSRKSQGKSGQRL